MSSAKPTTKTTPTQRLPAPSLFVGPPSRNASSSSLLPTITNTSTSRVPLARQRSLLGERPRTDVVDSASAAGGSVPGPFAYRQQQQQRQVEQQSNERTDAVWAEMQNTLEEVELSAINGTHVFNSNHNKALDELRAAQIALAQAWARGEADDEGREAEEQSNAKQDTVVGTADMLALDRAEKMGGDGAATSRSRSGTNRSTASGKTQLEEDTENDIMLARKRREANDRYFQRVNAGVLDVVAKLEEVAKAMKDVEQESKEIWGDNESIDTLGTASVT